MIGELDRTRVGTLVDLLRARAGDDPDRRAFTFLDDSGEETASLTYRELEERARALGAQLERMGARGSRALLLYPPGLDFIAAFLGCLYGGVAAVPAYPPRSPRTLPRLRAIARDARPSVALTTSALLPAIRAAASQIPELAGVGCLATDELDPGLAAEWTDPGAAADTLAFLQYTSGSTSAPKGVMVSHGNLLHNEAMIQRAFGQSERSRIVGWLPLYHDMGLIGNVLQPLYLGAPCVLMSPVTFLQRPMTWLRTISRYRATASGGPNFAYELCARKLPVESEGLELDLSCWEVAFNGAEPVRAETLDRFARAFAPYGFRREAFHPCYGLAEATLFVSGGTPLSAPVVRRFDGPALESGEARPAEDEASGRELVGCGHAWMGQEVVIADPETRARCAPGRVGEIWVNGPSVAQGYWERPEVTARDFQARLAGSGDTAFLRTGDLGFLSGGELFVTGRIKDLLIIRGRNLYPQDLELTAERSHPDLRPGCGAAVAVEVGGEERLVVVHEVDRHRREGFDEVADVVRRALAEEHEVQAHGVVLVRMGTIPKTSSGKIQRHACREGFLHGGLEVVFASVLEGGSAVEESAADLDLDTLRTLAPEERGPALLAHLRRRAARAIGVPASLLEPEQPLSVLGLDSAAAVELRNDVESAFGVALPLAGLIEGLSVAQVAGRVLARLEAPAPEAPVPRLAAGPAVDEYPLSYGQQALWLIDRQHPGSAAYVIAGAARVRGALDGRALRRAFEVLAERHPALRTTFHETKSGPVQRVGVATATGFVEEDAAAWSESEVAAWLEGEPWRAFDLTRGPVLRVAVLRRSPDEHLLVLAVHHVVADFWSLEVLVGELGLLLRDGVSASLPALPVSFADYVRWQREILDGPEGERLWAFWSRILAGRLPALDLPTDRPRPRVSRQRGAACSFRIGEETAAALRGLGRGLAGGGATLYAVLLTAFQTLLHRYGGADDVLVGSPTTGRSAARLAGLVGYFVNPVVLRGDLSGDPSFAELLARLRRTALDAFAHQDFPFPLLVERLQPERDPSRSPVFQAVLVLQKARAAAGRDLAVFALGEPGAAVDLGGLSMESVQLAPRAAQFDVSLAVAETSRDLAGTLIYDVDLFDASTAERMARHFTTLLAGAAADPRRRISELPLLTAAEGAQLRAWNATEVDFGPDACLHELIERQVARTPDAVAVSFEGAELTYRELDARAGRLARRLRALGVGPEVRVGISAERSLELVVGLVGILKAGGAYVPLDPGYPQERLAFLREDARIAVLLTREELLDRTEDVPDVELPAVLADNLAYVIYTSGSTGGPKGVMNSHRGIVNRLLWIQERYPLAPTDQVIQKTPFSFDVSVWEFFWPLITGARLVMARPGGHQDPAYLVDTIRREGITVSHFVPAMLQAFLEAPGVEECRSLERVMASGEALPPELEQRFFSRLGRVGTRLFNLYGPTEAAVEVTHWECSPGEGRTNVPIGWPVANTAIHLVGRSFESVPVGVAGELWIAGVQVARGYLGRPDLTAERFVPDPFTELPGARAYRSGDLARRRPDGAVEYLGRIDHQVKIRGFRIELGEIEAALGAHPEVREAVVMAREGRAAGDQRLVAWVAGREGAPDVTALRRHLARTLPKYMVPSAFVILDAMPLSPNGKVDRRALAGLPVPGAGAAVDRQGFVAARKPLEELLAGIWSEVLGVEGVGIEDDFFDLGGHSLLATHVASRLYKALGVEIPLGRLLELRTVAALAAEIETLRPGREGIPAVPESRQTPVEALDLARMREVIRADRAARLGPANRSAVFVLSSPGSGSGLLGDLLAGHPQLFAAPELELLSFHTLAERRAAFAGRDSVRLEGLTRAVLEIGGLDPGEAARLLEERERAGWTTQRLYGQLQEWLGNRLLVDRTPSYAFDLGVLARAEGQFEGARYIHLVRHPCGAIHSFEEPGVTPVSFLAGHSFSGRELAELLWVVSHDNIVRFLAGVPPERQHRVRFEDLVREPRRVLQEMCAFLGIEPRLHPQAGIGPAEPEEWRKHLAESSLGEAALQLAATLGYGSAEPGRERTGPSPVAVRKNLAALPLGRAERPPGAPGPLSFAQERLWLVEQMWPGTPVYNIPAGVRLRGRLDVAAFRAALSEVVRRHEALRTTFHQLGGLPVQVVVPVAGAGDHPLPIVDLSGLSPEGGGEREAEVLGLARVEARRPFDLAAGPLIRTTLLWLGEGEEEPEHVLLVTMHHIVSDGWSMGIFVRELAALYGAFSQGRPSPLPELALQYPDFALWQRRWLTGEVLEGELALWREWLAGAPVVLDLPTDRPRPPVQGHRGRQLPVRFPRELGEALASLAGGEKVTLFVVLLAGLEALLQRYSGQDDVLVGSPVANRSRFEIEGLIGFFVNTLVLRSDLSADPPVRELLRRVRTRVLAALAHQDLPFEKLVEALLPARDRSRSPLFQVMLVLQNTPLRLELPGLRLDLMEIDSGIAKFDLLFELREERDGLELHLEYNLDLFETSTADRMVGHFRSLLSGMAQDPQAPLSELPLLGEPERHQLLREWTGGAPEAVPADRACIHQWFEAWAARAPEAVAAVCGGERLTYGELNRRANRLARHLRSMGVGPEVLVGLCLERSLDIVVAILGVSKAGGGYLPLDPAYPRERLAFALEDSRAPVLVSVEALAGSLPASGARVVLLDRDAKRIARRSGADPAALTGPENVAYVIYTSGSTGRPKGVLVEHGNVQRLFAATERWYGFGPEDVWTLFHSYAFDFSVWELWGALAYGGRLVVVPHSESRSPRHFRELLARERVTVLNQTPSAFQQLLRVEEDAAAAGELPLALRWVIFGGEALELGSLRPWFELYGDRTPVLVNMYGITETTVHVTWRPLAMADVAAGRGSVIGRAIPDLTVDVLDPRTLRPQPIGVPGEMFVGGAGVARGYLDRPALTAQRFVPDPFGPPGARSYRSGDLARWRPDGDLEYLGRIDHQVKIRGFRIELGEIEAALGSHPAVREAVVLVRDGSGPGDRRLVAWVVSREGAPGVSELRRHLSETLPDYMVPSAFVFLDALPLTPNGKVDRKALPEPAGERPELGREVVAPRTGMERLLVELWRQILEVESVGIHDGFFELGGNSMLAATLSHRLQESLGEDVHVAAIFEAQTVAELAALMEERYSAAVARLAGTAAQQAPPESPLEKKEVPLERVERQPGVLLPLSFSQERLWLVDRMQPGMATYNLPLAVSLRGRPDVESLRAALTGIVRRHEALRTVFAVQDGDPHQVVSPPPASYPLPIIDLGALPRAEREREALLLGKSEAQRPFDLAAGPLLRTALVRLEADGEEQEHVLLIDMHHIVSDGWSLTVFLRELSVLYTAFSQGRPSPLPELPVQYPDFAVWQRRWLSGEVLDAHLAFWRERLAGAPVALELPTDRPRPPVQRHLGGHVPVQLPGDLTEAVANLAREEGATLFMILLAGVDALLYRYSGQDDLLLGTPIANRTRVETEALIGFFVNTLVLRSDLSGDPSVRELLGRIRRSALEAFNHQDLPFERLVEALQPVRDPSRSPVIQVMLAFQRASPALELPGLRLGFLEVESGASKFDLTFSFAESQGALGLALEYDRDLWEEATARRMVGHLLTLLAAAAAEPGQRLSELPLLTPAERAQLLEWNRTRTPVAVDRLFHELVAEQAARAPEATALVSGDRRLTYAELDARAERLAGHLRGLGIGPEGLVGLAVERSLEMVVGILGVLKAGGAFLPLDPGYPRERLELMISDAGPRVLLTQERLLPALPESTVPVVCLDRDWESLTPVEIRESGASLDNLAYVIYTSGSTGRPKGVGLTHRGLLNLCAAQIQTYATSPRDRVLQFASPSFDASIAELTIALRVGAELHLADRESLLPGPSLLALLRGRGITNVTLAPSVLAVLPDPGEVSLPELRTLLVAGEACPTELARSWAAGRSLFNAYGPTETTVWATVERCEDGRRLTIGRPIANTRVHLLDRFLREVPVGVPGELYIGGEGLARGYLGRPDLTAERFVPDPFGEAGSRLYRTGDLARFLPDGRIDYLGRVDHQVKLRGFRIELGEIEALLAAHPAVTEGVAVVREDLPGDHRLVAYAVAADRGADREALAEELAGWLGGRLPAYMAPSAVVVLEDLPLSPNGKVDRGALPVPQRAAGRGGRGGPRTPVEELLAGIWCKLLGLEQVGVEESFFTLGGHSLLATRLASRVLDTFGVDLPVRRLFEIPTIAGLAREIEAALASGSRVELPPIRPVPRGLESPLSFAQERLWFLEQMQPGQAAYNIPGAVRLQGELDVAAFHAALAEIARRHETLRTTFASRDGEPVQVVAPEPSLALPLIDLAALPEAGPAGRQAEALWLGAAEAGRPFDLAEGPLLRCALLRLGAREHLALLGLHHIVSDGWSMEVLFRELGVLYAAFSQGRPSPLPELPVQYADFAVWQRRWLSGEVLERQLAWWRELLAGAPASLELPADRPRPPVRTVRGGRVSLRLAGGLSADLQALGQRSGATLFMILLAAWNALLHRHGAGDDLVTGSPVAGRSRPEVETLIGFFVNTLALRTDLSGSPAFHELVHRVRETALGAYANQDVPFERLVQVLQPVRDPSRTPLFQVMLVLQNAPAAPLDLPGLAVAPLDLESRTAKFDLTLSLAGQGDGLSADLEYNHDLFDTATAERMLRHFRNLLQGAAADPERSLAALPLMDAEEIDQVVNGWNETATDYPREATVHGLFRKLAAERPEALAVDFAGEVLSYGELDRRSNRLAHHLCALGTGPEVAVGFCLERSADVVVAMLAILKTGAFYVPLDPSYPEERLAFMLEDTAVPVLVTREDLAAGLLRKAMSALTAPPALVRLDADAETLAGRSGADLGERAVADNTAYVMYTSGSTGRPKGVMIPHRGIVRLVVDTNYARLGPGDRVCQTSNPAFDATTFEVWAALLNGAALIGVPREVSLSPGDLASWIRERKPTTMFLTTALFEQVARDNPGAFAGLREVLFGGEACDPVRLREVLAAEPPERLLNGYGPTESTTFATIHQVRQVPEGAVSVPIGRPIANTTVYLVDPTGQPVPVGVPGELAIGGDGLARGYLSRPELTAERFVPDPFGGVPGARLYRTGDLARFLPECDIEFLGRLDQQVKIRGFRIEPGEIEAALTAHPAVREAVVLVRDRGAGKALVACVALGEPEGAGAPELRDFLRRRLPEHMVPAFFVMLSELPLTPNGKVDRRALAGIEPVAEQEGAAPRNPVEEMLAGFWAEVLGLERVGIHDNFFELGGHSLLATRLVSRIRSALRVELPLGLLFQHPTVAGLAAALDLVPEAAAAPPVEPGPRSPEGDDLSFSQQRLWFLDRLEPGSSLYNIPLAYRLRGALDLAGWAATLDEVVRRHESFRTTFAEMDGRPLQRVSPPRSSAPPVIDLAALPSPVREAEAARLAGAEARRPFDLQAGPLVRFSVLRLGAEDHLVLLTQHHIVSDGWSVGVLAREIEALYGAFVRREPSPLPEPPVQYIDYARWQRRWLQGELLDEGLASWRQRLAGLPLLELPTDRPRPPLQTFRGRSRSRVLPERLERAVTALGRREGATLFMTLLAVFQVLLHRASGQDDFAVGSPVANRNRREIEGVIGFFVNTLALRADLHGDPSFRELLARVRQTALEAFAHQEIPLERLVEELAPDRDLSRPPLFQVAFTVQEASPGLDLPGLRAEPVPIESRDAKFELALGAAPAVGGLGVAIGFNTDLFDGVRIERMLGHYANLLEAAAEDPERRLSQLSLLSAAERHQMLVEWNASSGADELPDITPATLFERQVARTPEAVALELEGERLTYRELDGLSTRVAQRLLGLGVGPEVRVALCLQRSFPMIAALLGVFKAGGAYVPLDPSYPQERLAFMLEDSGASVLLAETATREALPPCEIPVVLLDEEPGSPEAVSVALPAAGGHPENAAYVIYTSGSTGVPKGVVVPRRALINLLLDRCGTLEAADRLLMAVSISFDASILAVFTPLAVGACIVLSPEGGHRDADHLVRSFEELGITAGGATPAMLAALLDKEGFARCRLRRFVTGAEAVPSQLTERALEMGISGIFNLYGPTETTVTVIEWRCREREASRVLPIGRPIAGARAYLLDAAGNPVPAGVPGELFIGGPPVARGYLNRPELTAERYVPDPFSAFPGGRLYRTGDLARSRGDGVLEFMGRADGQVKIRGFRVELGEIEAALAGCPGVRDVAVVAQEDRAAGTAARRLAAFLVPDDPAAPPPTARLRAFLADRLPEHMIPSVFVALESLPIAPSGKVDRAALSRLEPSTPVTAELAERYVAPRDTLELRLCQLWEAMLGVERVGVRDSFFELGGHSLLAVRLMGRLTRLAGRELPLATLFQAPTVEQMARLLRQGEEATAWSPLVPLRETSPGQRRPFFCIHPIGGAVFCYRSLAGRLGPDQPFYGLEARGLFNGTPPHTEIPEMAAEYLEAVRALQPGGPYLLGGWSFGGLVALEMARRLEEQGERVGLLALIDTVSYGREAGGQEVPEGDEALVLELLAGDLGGLAGRPLELSKDELEQLPPEERLPFLVEKASRAGALPPDLSLDQARRLARLYQANARAMATYVPPACGSRITLLLGSESPSRERVEEWTKIAAGGLDVVELPGDHYTLLQEPRVGDLAAAIRRGLDRAHETMET